MLVAPGLAVLLPGEASAGTLTTTYLRLDRLKAAQGTSFRLQFKAVSSQTANVTIDFTAAWASASGAVNATQTITTAACATETGDTALPGSITAAGSGNVITISSVGATTSGTTYCADLTSATAVTDAAAGEYYPVITIGTDSTTVAVRTISEDQVQVSATVPPTFNFVFNNTTTDAFGNLSTSSTTDTTGKTITLTTNANSGWIVWVKDLSSGLASTAGAHTIASTTAGTSCATGHDISGGTTEGYGLVASINTDATGGGTVTLDNNYNCAAGSAGGLDTTYRPVATANGTANGDIIAVKERAKANGSTPAANDYADTLTFTGAGNF